jgi:hypothetical protein
MTNEIFWRYEPDYLLHALEVWVHEAGRVIREWAVLRGALNRGIGGRIHQDIC